MQTDLLAERVALLEELATRRAERSLAAFIRQAWPVVEPFAPYSHNWHIDATAEHLEAVSRGEIRNLLINFPPGYMKSLLVSVFWPAWEWAKQAHLRYLCISYDEKLSIRDNRRCRDLIRSEWYQARWPLRLSGDQNQKTRYDTADGGWRIGTSIGGRGLGEHPHRKIIDDPHKVKQAESAAERQEAIEFYTQTLATRGRALKAATVLIMQRIHQQDLAGHILKTERDDWTHVCLPMRYEPKRMVTTATGFDDPRTTPGELLWPSLFPEELCASLERQMGSYGAAGQLQQRPVPAAGGVLQRPWWRYYDPTLPVQVTRVVISLDPALKTKDADDFSVFQVWGQQGADRFYLRKDKGRWSETELVDRGEALYQWARKTYPDAAITVAIENTAAGPEVIARLRRVVTGVKAITVGGGARRARYSGDKVQRAHAASPMLESGNIYAPGAPDGTGQSYDPTLTPVWVQETIDECASFPRGSYDDEVDAFVIAQLEIEQGPQVLAAVIRATPQGPQPSAALQAIRRRKQRGQETQHGAH